MAGKKKTNSNSPKPSDSADTLQDTTSTFASRTDSGSKKIRSTLSKRAGIQMPVARMLRVMRHGNYAKHIQVGAAVYCAAAMDYLVAEVMEMSGDCCRENKRKRITPRHIALSVRSDPELAELLKNIVISEGGVVPSIHSFLLPKKTVANASKVVADPDVSPATPSNS